jgi:hypothetical protein
VAPLLSIGGVVSVVGVGTVISVLWALRGLRTQEGRAVARARHVLDRAEREVDRAERALVSAMTAAHREALVQLVNAAQVAQSKISAVRRQIGDAIGVFPHGAAKLTEHARAPPDGMAASVDAAELARLAGEIDDATGGLVIAAQAAHRSMREAGKHYRAEYEDAVDAARDQGVSEGRTRRALGLPGFGMLRLVTVVGAFFTMGIGISGTYVIATISAASNSFVGRYGYLASVLGGLLGVLLSNVGAIKPRRPLNVATLILLSGSFVWLATVDTTWSQTVARLAVGVFAGSTLWSLLNWVSGYLQAHVNRRRELTGTEPTWDAGKSILAGLILTGAVLSALRWGVDALLRVSAPLPPIGRVLAARLGIEVSHSSPSLWAGLYCSPLVG